MKKAVSMFLAAALAVGTFAVPLTLLQMFRNIGSSMESMTLCAGVFRNQISMGLHLPVFI